LERNDLGARLIVGAVAGGAGSAALNLVTYVDMLLRGRPASSVPKADVQELEALASIPEPRCGAERKARSYRESAAGALIGYLVGIGIGTLSGALWPTIRHLPRPLAGVLVATAAIAGSDVPSVALATTDPRSWRPAGWIADLVPHAAYGFVTVAVVDALLTRNV
jgi:hypothetical protein